ncbi:MAG: hypothetical protein C0487_04325 [Leptothrix sp. (in: Bacteria)]|nr:hypothetical protein [Leptothrix sp. (in: b-proteobacteria)]
MGPVSASTTLRFAAFGTRTSSAVRTVYAVSAACVRSVFFGEEAQPVIRIEAASEEAKAILFMTRVFQIMEVMRRILLA